MTSRWIAVVMAVVVLIVVGRFLWLPVPKALTASELLSEAEDALQQSGYDVLARIEKPKLTNHQNAEGLILFSSVDLERALITQNHEQLLHVPVALLAVTSADGEAKLVPSALPVNIWSANDAAQALNIKPILLGDRIPPSQLESPRPLEVVPSTPLRVTSTLPYPQTLARIEEVAKSVLGEESIWSMNIERRISTSENGLARSTLLVMFDGALPGSTPHADTGDLQILNCCHRILVTQNPNGDVTVLVKPLNSLDNLAASTAHSPVCSRPTPGEIVADGAAMAATEMSCPFDAAVWFSLQRISSQ